MNRKTRIARLAQFCLSQPDNNFDQVKSKTVNTNLIGPHLNYKLYLKESTHSR